MPEQTNGSNLFEDHQDHPIDAAVEAGPGVERTDSKDPRSRCMCPHGGNMQRWRFLVIRDPKIKARVGSLYKRVSRTS
jgi:hypothetical protein